MGRLHYVPLAVLLLCAVPRVQPQDRAVTPNAATPSAVTPGAVTPSAVLNPTPDIGTIVQRMARARNENQSLLRPYTVTRDYMLVGKDRKEEKARVLVQITFTPPSAKQFVIQESSGTRFGERAVRQMLEHETDIVRDHDSTEMSLANYEFNLVRTEPCGAMRCFVLAITPRRKDKTLLKGHIWVDAKTYLIHRTEGEPAKGPSWWLRDSSIVFTYGDVRGMWLQTASESTSNVRFVGRYTMFSKDLAYVVSEPPKTVGSIFPGPKEWRHLESK